MSVLVIAEPGCTAEGDYDTMLRLLQTAKDSGADVWKPQFTTNAARHLERRSAWLSAEERDAFYAKYEAAYHWLQWPAEWHRDFASRCRQLGMKYACSVCLPEDVPVVAPFVEYMKISSFEQNDDAVCFASIDGQGSYRTIVSFGMSTDEDTARPGAARLHCVSSYPAPIEAMNLSVLRPEFREMWFFSGLSDHSRHLLTGAVAVGAGAEIIETHYRLDDCDPENPDYAVAFSPAEFTQYVRNIRDAEAMMGDGIKRIQECEKPMLRYKVTA